MKTSSVYSNGGSAVPDLNEYSAYSMGLQKKTFPVYELGYQDLDFRSTRFREANHKSLRAVIPANNQFAQLTKLCREEAELVKPNSMRQEISMFSAALPQEDSHEMKVINFDDMQMSRVIPISKKKVEFRKTAEGNYVYAKLSKERLRLDEEQRQRDFDDRKEAERRSRVKQNYEIKDDLGRVMVYDYNGKMCPESDNPKPVITGTKNIKKHFFWH